MPIDNLNMDEVTEERRKALAASIRSISIEELKTLGAELFPTMDHPWRETYFDFLKENAGASFYHATTLDHVHFIYCAEKDKGLWFLPDSGKGPLGPRGLAIMKDLAAGAH